MIQWHEWDATSLELAKQQNKPIFLSVGYFTCFWCHIVEHQVYRDPMLAEVLNRDFIAIKVDKDERPDIDEIYLHARLLITGHSGWPNHVFLTPEGEPFLALGVVLPKPGKRTMAEMVQEVALRWSESEAQLREAAQQIAGIVVQEFSGTAAEGDGTPDKRVAETFYHYLQQVYDHENGGFYQEPKFPHESYLQFLLAYHRERGEDQALEMAALSMKKMAAGAVYDHVGGGFHRYTIDKAWQAPHFEKMLYNQALQGQCFAELYALSGKAYHRDIAEEIFDFALAELRSPDGAFYAAIDAETDGVEGAYYALTEQEIASALSAKEQELFARCYGLAEIPEQPGHPAPEGGVLYARQHLMALANEKNRSYESLRADLKPILNKLKALRDKRKKPDIDTKIITAWNGLMISALAGASTIFERADYKEAAIKAAEFILKHLRIDGDYMARVWREEHAMSHGYLQDYAYMEAALLSLYQITGERKWLDKAQQLHRLTDEMFWDTAEGGYFVTDGKENLIVRIHRGHDTGLPSDSGVMLQNLMSLYDITGDESWLARARMIMAVYNKSMQELPADYSTMLQAVLYLYRWTS